jgi:hypothetical protein
LDRSSLLPQAEQLYFRTVRDQRSLESSIKVYTTEAASPKVNQNPKSTSSYRQIHRLKSIKRQMYGRAGFDLLRLRVLHSA